MMKTLYIGLFCLFLVGPLMAKNIKKIEIPVNTVIDCDMDWSFIDFAKVDKISNLEPGTTVYRSIFSRETPKFEIFDATMTGVTFIRCPLDNIKIPNGNKLIDCQTKQFKAQADGDDWFVDDQNQPVSKLKDAQ